MSEARAAMLDRKAAATSNAFGLLSAGGDDNEGQKRSKAAKRRERQKEAGIDQSHKPDVKQKAKAKVAAPSYAAAAAHGVPEHNFDRSVIHQAMNMGFSETKVVEALDRMLDHGYDTTDVNALLDRLTCTDDWHSSKHDRPATAPAADRKGKKAAVAFAAPQPNNSAATHANGNGHTAPSGSSNGGVHLPPGRDPVKPMPSVAFGSFTSEVVTKAPVVEYRHPASGSPKATPTKAKVKGGANSAEQMARDLVSASRVAHESGGNARTALWTQWDSMLNGSHTQTWVSEETGEKMTFSDIFIKFEALRAILRSVVSRPVESEEEQGLVEGILSKVLEVDEDFLGYLVQGLLTIANGLANSNRETSAVVGEALAENFCHFQKRGSGVSALEKDLFELENKIEGKLQNNAPAHELHPLYEQQKEIFRNLLGQIQSPAGVEEAYSATALKLDEHILKMGQMQDKLTTEQIKVQSQRQDLERNKLAEYKAAQKTLMQLQEETGLLLARKGELELELKDISEKISSNTRQLLDMENLSVDDIHQNRITALIEDETSLRQKLASQRDDYDRLQKVQNFLAASFSSLKERAELRHTSLKQVLENGSDRYLSSLRVTMAERVQEAQMSKDKLRLLARNMARIKEDIEAMEQMGTPEIGAHMRAALQQMVQAEVDEKQKLRASAEEARERKREVSDLVSMQGARDAAGAAKLMALLSELVGYGEIDPA